VFQGYHAELEKLAAEATSARYDQSFENSIELKNRTGAITAIQRGQPPWHSELALPTIYRHEGEFDVSIRPHVNYLADNKWSSIKVFIRERWSEITSPPPLAIPSNLLAVTTSIERESSLKRTALHTTLDLAIEIDDDEYDEEEEEDIVTPMPKLRKKRQNANEKKIEEVSAVHAVNQACRE
jgi:hypothetical protein